MPNTTNYSFPTPADTDLVKNGADAIRDLGDAVDTAMNTALGTKKAGMVLLNTTSFSAVSSISAPANTFTSTYNMYRVLFNGLISTSNQTLSLRLRASGTDRTSLDYYSGAYEIPNSGGATTTQQNSGSSWTIGSMSTANQSFLTLDIRGVGFNSLTSNITGLFASGVGLGGRFLGGLRGPVAAETNDSLTFFPAANNITGSMSIYGYNV